MRLVIPYTLPADGGIELRYAIRSMVKHFKPLSGVLLIGDKPEWYTGDHIPYDDIPGNKERSMQMKVLQCPDDVFLYSNDDFFALQDFDENIPDYFDHTCVHYANVHPQNSYRRMYVNCPQHWLNYDVHTPTVFRGRMFAWVYSRQDPDLQTPIKTTYKNHFNGANAAYLCDCKLRGEHSVEEIEYAIKDRPFFSTHNSAINDAMIEVFEKYYPDGSPYERN